jgi:gamma-glutamylputrescine oxidase
MPLLDTDRELTANSYYAATVPARVPLPPLAGRVEADVAVVGGGLAGLSAALELARRGFSVVLLEARHVGFGASGRNGGQAIHGLACEIDTIEQQLGAGEARRVWDMSIEALDLLRERIARHRIACHWQDGWLGLATSAGKARELFAGADHLESAYGYPLERIAAADTARWIASRRYAGGVYDPRSGHLHPLAYTLGLAEAAVQAGVRLHEGTPAIALAREGARHVVKAPRGEVHAAQLLLAGNVYLDALAPELRPRIMPVGTYIACSEPLGKDACTALIPSRAAVCDTNFVLDYFRPTHDHRMLYGGRVSYSTATPPNLGESMRQRMVSTFPQLADAKVEYAWGGFVDITMSRAPDFGRRSDGAYYLQGFSGHGLALTGLAGLLVAQAIAGDASRFDVFAKLPHRPFPGGRRLRTPALVLGMAWYRLRDLLA